MGIRKNISAFQARRYCQKQIIILQKIILILNLPCNERQDKELPDDYNGLMPVIEEPQAAYNREDRVKEITQQLEDGIKDMFTSENTWVI